MRRIPYVAPLIVLVVLGTSNGGQDTLELKVTDKGDPKANVEGFVYDQGQVVPLGSTGANGLLSLDSSLLSLLRVKTAVVVQECPDATRVTFVTRDESDDGCSLMNENDDDCDDDCSVVAWLWGDELSLGSSLSPWWYVAPVAGGGLAILSFAGGDDNGQPSPNTVLTDVAPQPSLPSIDGFGIWTVGPNIQVTGGDAAHDCCTNFRNIGGWNIESTPGSIKFTGPDPWVTVMGDFTEQTGAFDTNGIGTVAGFPNVAVGFQGTIDASGNLTGRYTMGTGGELPGGRPIEYTLQATLQ